MFKPIPLKELQEQFTYDADKGRFLHKHDKRTGNMGQIISARAGDEAGTVRKNGYGQMTIVVDGKQGKYLIHRCVFAIEHGVEKFGELDHIDRNKLNNHISNLREVSHRQNQCNRMHNGKPPKGFWKASNNSWQVRISDVNGKQINKNVYSEEQARALYAELRATRELQFNSAQGENFGQY